MDDGIMLTIDNDGVAHAYDDTYDVIIHCESQEDQDEVKRRLKASQRWIPCSERLPEKGQGCLVCDKGKIIIDTFLGQGNPYNWRWYVRDYEAWMPLPEPYKGGEQDEQTN